MYGSLSSLIVKPLFGHSRPFHDNTEKLELPSISQVHTRGSADVPWYNAHSAQRSLLSGDRLPNLQLPQTYASQPASGTPPRVGSFDSGSNYSNNYTPSLTSASSYPADPSTGLKTPSPSEGSPNVSSHVPKDTALPYSSQAEGGQIYAQESDPYSAMNQPQQYIDSRHSHMSTGPSYATQPQTTGGMSHYSQYAQQAPSLQNGPSSYGQTQPSYSQYYGGDVTSPQSTNQPVATSMVSQLLPLPGRSSGKGTRGSRVANMS